MSMIECTRLTILKRVLDKVWPDRLAIVAEVLTSSLPVIKILGMFQPLSRLLDVRMRKPSRFVDGETIMERRPII